MEGTKRDSLCDLYLEHDVDGDWWQETCEQADHYGMESLTEDAQAILNGPRPDDVLEYMSSVGYAPDGQRKPACATDTGRYVEISAKGKTMEAYESVPDGDVHEFWDMSGSRDVTRLPRDGYTVLQIIPDGAERFGAERQKMSEQLLQDGGISAKCPVSAAKAAERAAFDSLKRSGPMARLRQMTADTDERAAAKENDGAQLGG